MPVGGPKRGPGRPKGIPNKRHQITVADIGHADYMPIEYMLALMRDENCEPTRRDLMAIQAAPYCHARLNAVATTNANASKDGAGDVNIVQIFAVPRGAAFDVKSGTVTIEHDAGAGATVEPFEGTPPLKGDEHMVPNGPAPGQSLVRAEPLPVFEMDTANVTRLDAYREDRED